MRVRNTYILQAIVVLLVGGIVVAIASRTQRKLPTQSGTRLKLEYGNPDLKSGNYTPLAVAPIPMSRDRLLVPVGDTLYMLDSNNRIVWDYPFEPDIILDVMVDPKGDIYTTASEALILVLNSSGKEIWRTGMGSGSAWYTQIKSYGEGFLVIVDMQAYREKGSTSEDILEFWKDRKQQWSKPFPVERNCKSRELAFSQSQQPKRVVKSRRFDRCYARHNKALQLTAR